MLNKKVLRISRSELFGISGLIVFVIALLLVGSRFDMSFINDYVESAGVWAPLAFIVAKAGTIVVAPLSGTPLYILVGTLFGVSDGILYAFLGDLLGFSILFFLSRVYGLKAIGRLVNKKDSRFILIIQKNTSDTRSFIKVCLSLFWFPEAAIAAAGLGKLKYLTVMLIFMPIYTIIASLVIFVSSAILLS